MEFPFITDAMQCINQAWTTEEKLPRALFMTGCVEVLLGLMVYIFRPPQGIFLNHTMGYHAALLCATVWGVVPIVAGIWFSWKMLHAPAAVLNELHPPAAVQIELHPQVAVQNELHPPAAVQNELHPQVAVQNEPHAPTRHAAVLILAISIFPLLLVIALAFGGHLATAHTNPK